MVSAQRNAPNPFVDPELGPYGRTQTQTFSQSVFNKLKSARNFSLRALNSTVTPCFSCMRSSTGQIIKFTGATLSDNAKLLSKAELSLAIGNALTSNSTVKGVLAFVTMGVTGMATTGHAINTWSSEDIEELSQRIAFITVDLLDGLVSSLAIHASAKTGSDSEDQTEAEIFAGVAIALLVLRVALKSCCSKQRQESDRGQNLLVNRELPEAQVVEPPPTQPQPDSELRPPTDRIAGPSVEPEPPAAYEARPPNTGELKQQVFVSFTENITSDIEGLRHRMAQKIKSNIANLPSSVQDQFHQVEAERLELGRSATKEFYRLKSAVSIAKENAETLRRQKAEYN